MLEPLNTAFGRVLCKLRKEIGVSQEDLADRAGLHRTYVSQLERGLKSPSLKAINALAQALGKEPHELVKAAEEGLGDEKTRRTVPGRTV